MASTQLLAILKYLMRIVTIGASGRSVYSPLNCIHRQEIYVRNRIPITKKKTAVEKTDDALETHKKTPKKIISEETQGEDAESDEPSKVGIWIKFEDSVLVDTTSTFKTSVEQSGYTLAHSAMGRSKILLIGNTNGDVGIFRRNGSTYYDPKFELGAKAVRLSGIAGFYCR